jgi:hypothetical protein
MRQLASILLLLLALAALAGATWLNPRLTAQRAEQHLVPAAPTETMPPLLAFTTVTFGGFRGIVADILWLRATELQERGQYFELVQLADWITKLEPRFTAVWAFQAWNMAYNVSVLLNDPAERWRWVRQGVDLLRDSGLYYNPGSAGLYHELAWLFFHKLGQDSDQAHFFYKQAWADEMMTLFGGPQPDFARLLAAPQTESDLLGQPAAAACVAALRQLDCDPFSGAWLDASNRPPAVAKILNDAAGARALLDFVRVQQMRTVYKLDPATLQRVEAAYGPLDWRLPDAHAIYWAAQGKPIAKDFDVVKLDRLIFQALADAFRQGRLMRNAEERLFILTPNLDLLPRVNNYYIQSVREHPDNESIRTAHANFLKDAIGTLYLFHRNQEAAARLAELSERYPGNVTTNNLDLFVANDMAANADAFTAHEATAQIEGMAYQSAFWLIAGDGERAAGFEQLARRIWQRYMDKRSDPQYRERTGLPPYEELRRQAFTRARAAAQGDAARARLDAALMK